jgi:hypothetical protein
MRDLDEPARRLGRLVVVRVVLGRPSSRMSSNCVSAPALAAPSRAVCSAARLFEILASEPPRPTIVNASAIG